MRALAVMGMEEVTEMVSSREIIKPRELRHEPRMIIFCKYTQEAAQPEFWPRAAKHPISR